LSTVLERGPNVTGSREKRDADTIEKPPSPFCKIHTEPKIDSKWLGLSRQRSDGITDMLFSVNPGSDLEPAEFQQVEQVLGLPLRIVWRHI
jgi:hypothetical protein